MKTLQSVLFCFFLMPLVAFAQNEKIEQLKNEVRASAGAVRAQKLIQLADAAIAANNYELAEDSAEEAEKFADKAKAAELRAIAYNREGKAMLLMGKKRAAGRFESSLEILKKTGSTNRTLALDNLEQLKRLATANGRDKELARINEAIARLSGGGEMPAANVATAPAAGSSAATALEGPVTKNELKQELTALRKQLETNQKVYNEAQIRQLEESKVLRTQLAQKEEEIDLMNEAQMRSAMLLMQQRYMLDSLGYRSNLDSLALLNTNLALGEAESKRNMYLSGLLAMLILVGLVFYGLIRARQHARILAEKNSVIREEQERSESLLLNILPKLVADELKSTGHTKARYIEDVSVLFADFVGFSAIAEKLNPSDLVKELDTCFKAFDDIIAKHNLEKIKTIGDAYMCAGGLPNGGGSNIVNMVRAARDMQNWLLVWNAERERIGLPRFDARIGIHNGPVVAGVVGSKKFAFDIWGDTVNIASRVEQAGEGGKVNLSGTAYQAVKDHFKGEYRGKIPVKNRGEIDMYFV